MTPQRTMRNKKLVGRAKTCKVYFSEGSERPDFRNVVEVRIAQDNETELHILFDPEHNLEERILQEQFVP